MGRVSGESCGESSGPRRKGTKFHGKEEARGCTAMRCSSDSMACIPARPSTSQPSQTRTVSLSPAPTSMILIGPCLTAHRSAVRSTDSAYRQTATYAGVSRVERQAELVELGGTPGAPGKRIRRLLHGEAEVSFREQGVRERAGLCDDVSLVDDAMSRGNEASGGSDGAA
jgi:hypothetical protein